MRPLEPLKFVNPAYQKYTTSELTPLVPINRALSSESLDAYARFGSTKATAPAATRTDKMLGRGIQGAQLAARYTAKVFLLEELLLGTGVNPTKDLDIQRRESREKHLIDLFEHPLSTGVAGTFVGLSVLIFTVKGAIAGAVVGSVIGGANYLSNNALKLRDPSVGSMVGTGAEWGVIAGAALGFVFALTDLIALNAARLAFALLKAILVVPFAAIGFAAGGAYGAVEKRSSSEPEMVQQYPGTRFAPPPNPPSSLGSPVTLEEASAASNLEYVPLLQDAAW